MKILTHRAGIRGRFGTASTLAIAAVLGALGAAGCGSDGGSTTEGGGGEGGGGTSSSSSASSSSSRTASSSSSGSGGGPDLCGDVACQPSDACHVAGICDPATGVCSDPVADDGTACDDGDACTQTDTCQAGACVGGDAVTCTASDDCHGVGTCEPATGECSDPELPDGTTCDDGDGCTQTDVCEAGLCLGSNTITCPTTACQVPVACDAATGACPAPTAAADGTACPCGACSTGACVGHLIGDSATHGSTPQPTSIDVDADHVYVGNLYLGVGGDASVLSLPKDGGARLTIGTGFTAVIDVAVAGANLYFIDRTGLWKGPTNASATPTLVAAEGGTGMTSVVADATHVYVSATTAGTITAYPLAGGAAVVLATGQSAPGNMAIDATSLYWLDGTQSVRKMPLAGGAVTTLATGFNSLFDLTVDANNVYFTEIGAGLVESVPIAGGAATQLATGQSSPRGIAVVDGFVHWANYGDGSTGNVKKVPVGGGTVVTVPVAGAALYAPAAMTHDASCIYWVDLGASGGVWSSPP